MTSNGRDAAGQRGGSGPSREDKGDASTLPPSQLPLPGAGKLYEFEGQRVKVPAEWPLSTKQSDGRLIAGLGIIVRDVLGPHARLTKKPGGPGRYLTETRGRGLADVGKETMLRIMARVQKLAITDPEEHAKILEHHPWMTTDDPDWVARLWHKTRTVINHMMHRQGSNATSPGAVADPASSSDDDDDSPQPQPDPKIPAASFAAKSKPTSPAKPPGKLAVKLSPSTRFLPAPGELFEFEGQKVAMPAVWPQKPIKPPELLCKPLARLIRDVLGPNPSLIRKADCRGIYLKESRMSKGLSDVGKETMLHIMARVQKLAITDPEQYAQILSSHPWLTTKNTDWVACLWEKTRSAMHWVTYGPTAEQPQTGPVATKKQQQARHEQPTASGKRKSRKPQRTAGHGDVARAERATSTQQNGSERDACSTESRSEASSEAPEGSETDMGADDDGRVASSEDTTEAVPLSQRQGKSVGAVSSTPLEQTLDRQHLLSPHGKRELTDKSAPPAKKKRHTGLASASAPVAAALCSPDSSAKAPIPEQSHPCGDDAAHADTHMACYSGSGRAVVPNAWALLRAHPQLHMATSLAVTFAQRVLQRDVCLAPAHGDNVSLSPAQLAGPHRTEELKPLLFQTLNTFFTNLDDCSDNEHEPTGEPSARHTYTLVKHMMQQLKQLRKGQAGSIVAAGGNLSAVLEYAINTLLACIQGQASVAAGGPPPAIRLEDRFVHILLALRLHCL